MNNSLPTHTHTVHVNTPSHNSTHFTPTHTDSPTTTHNVQQFPPPPSPHYSSHTTPPCDHTPTSTPTQPHCTWPHPHTHMLPHPHLQLHAPNTSPPASSPDLPPLGADVSGDPQEGGHRGVEIRPRPCVPPLLPPGEAPPTSQGARRQSPRPAEGLQRTTDQKVVIGKCLSQDVMYLGEEIFSLGGQGDLGTTK